MRESLRVLLIMPPSRCGPLLDHFDRLRAECCFATDLQEVRLILEANPAVDVVFTEEILPDSDWKSVLEYISKFGEDIPVILCPNRPPDALLWGEALHYGIHDVLVDLEAPEEIEFVLNTLSFLSPFISFVPWKPTIKGAVQ